MYEIYLVYTVSFIAGSVTGLLLSYRKYREPFVEEKIDPLALIVALVGWVVLVNAALAPFTPLLRTGGFFMVALVAGMRPGYGRYETVLGAAVAFIIWLLAGNPGW
ncbi:DUF2104 domain-containing protein [Methanothermobacter sp. KEPCO-1]|nr:DUF2104 domain-containing protein [Methanothermobacter sp. KEPCO-1]